MSKYVSSSGVRGRERRPRGSTTTFDADVAKDPERLAALLNRAMERLDAIEASKAPEFIEFDVSCPSSGTVTLNHGFSGATRWYVTSWRRKGNAGAYSLSELTPGTIANTIVLTSKAAGQAVIRVESVQIGQELRSTATNDTALPVISSVPGNDHDVIVRLSGALTGVAPGTANNVLRSNGTDWVSTASTSLPSQLGWRTAYDIDFTTGGLSTAVADGNFTIAGQTWTVQNFSKSSVMSVGDANGMRIKAAASSSVITPPSRTGPIFKSPSMFDLLVTGGFVIDDIRIGLRVTMYLASASKSVIGDSTFMLVDTGSNNQRTEFSRYLKSTGPTVIEDFMRLVLNNSSKTASDIGAAAGDCLQIEIPYLGNDFNFLRTGTYSAGFPTKWAMRAEDSSAAGTWGPVLMQNLSDSFISIGIEAASGAGTSESKINRLLIEYYRYY